MEKIEKLKLKAQLVASRAQILGITCDPSNAPYFAKGDYESLENALKEIDSTLKELETL